MPQPLRANSFRMVLEMQACVKDGCVNREPGKAPTTAGKQTRADRCHL